MSGATFRQNLPNFGDRPHGIGDCPDCASARRKTDGRIASCWYCEIENDPEPGRGPAGRGWEPGQSGEPRWTKT